VPLFIVLMSYIAVTSKSRLESNRVRSVSGGRSAGRDFLYSFITDGTTIGSLVALYR
jgi:hypothetical protein